MAVTPLFGARPLTARSHNGGALHLTVSRSAAVRLAPVMAALDELGMPQSALELSGPPARARLAAPRTTTPPAPAMKIAAAVDAALARVRPAFVLVAGDGDGAVAAAMSAERHGVRIARIGAGLRCDDRGVGSEINRIVLDELADRLYVDGDDAAERLQAEGFARDRVVRVGSTLPDAVARWCPPVAREPSGEYVLVALHKPENVGDDARLAAIADALDVLARTTTVLVCGEARGLSVRSAIVRGPFEYPEFLALQRSARAVITDSAGVQEETTVMGVPCFTLAHATERTLTLTHGTNVLLGDDPAEIAEVTRVAIGEGAGAIPLWDGDAGRRIAVDLAGWSGA